MMLSAHFALEELIATQVRGLDNTPSPEVCANLTALAKDLLEPVRTIVGPMHINSGYRSPQVNSAVGGQPNSQHCLGLAADWIPLQISKKEAVSRILQQKIAFDQLIAEFWTPEGGGWIHLSYPPAGKPPRKQALMIAFKGQYVPLNLEAL